MELNDFMAAMQQQAAPKKAVSKNANAKFVCPECGQGMETNLKDCPNCGCPKEELIANDVSTNISPALESSNNFNAEHVVNGVAKGILTSSIFIAIVGIACGIVIICVESMLMALGGILLCVGLLILFFGIINWAVLRLLVNISYRLTRIDNKQ